MIRKFPGLVRADKRSANNPRDHSKKYWRLNTVTEPAVVKYKN